MVALAGRGWQLAPSLVRHVAETDKRYPNRSTVSDGTIGDAEHAARLSFHNPSGGYVDALDLTHDPAHGFDVHAHADEVVARRPAWLDHVISNRRIASGTSKWVWLKYTGVNPHDKHAHFAVLRNPIGRASTVSWYDDDPDPTPAPVPEDDDMPQPPIAVPDKNGDIHRFAKGVDGALWWQPPGKGWVRAVTGNPNNNTDKCMGSGPSGVLDVKLGLIRVGCAGPDGQLFETTWNGAVFAAWVPLGGTTAV